MITAQEHKRIYNRERQRAWRAANPENYKAYSAAYYAANVERMRKTARESLQRLKAKRGHAWELWAAARDRSSRKGRPFDIEPSDIQIPETCAILGMTLSRGKGQYHDASPTLDCIDPVKGYVKGNVRVISRRANMLKSNATSAEMRRILADLLEHGL